MSNPLKIHLPPIPPRYPGRVAWCGQSARAHLGSRPRRDLFLPPIPPCTTGRVHAGLRRTLHHSCAHFQVLYLEKLFYLYKTWKNPDILYSTIVNIFLVNHFICYQEAVHALLGIHGSPTEFWLFEFFAFCAMRSWWSAGHQLNFEFSNFRDIRILRNALLVIHGSPTEFRNFEIFAFSHFAQNLGNLQITGWP